ncbi:MAG TPA: HAD family hydrolase [Pseudonocardiaceae bacterium]
MAEQALLVDLDGTLYRGDGAVLAYADHVAATLPPADADRFRAALTDHLTGAAAIVTATDGWEAVQALARRLDVGQPVLDRAFLVSRQALTDPVCPIETPPDLVPALRRLRPTTRLVLATNSPADWLTALLARLAAADVFDQVITGARKPAGMPDILAGLAASVGATDRPWRVFSVGDHWRNDIEPARAFGATTGYIDRFGRNDGPADVVAPDLEGVLPTILRWAEAPDAFADPDE